MSDVKYPKPKLERKEKVKQVEPKLDAEKYHKVVEAHSPEATVVTRREKHKENKNKKPDEQLQDQSLMARVLKAVKKW